ncbi:MAG: DUF3800 domain-containing protein [Cypionkella sp.]
MEKVDDSFAYVLYIDEAGDDGLRHMRPQYPEGSTEWLCLAGYLVRANRADSLPSVLRSIRMAINSRQAPSLHYKDLSSSKRLKVCELLAEHSARAFVVCSWKHSLVGYQNSRAARAGTNQWIYNFLIRMLLERVTDFCHQDAVKKYGSPRCVRVIFSARGGHRFGQMKAYITQLKAQATAGSTFLARRVIRPEVLRFNLIEQFPHYMEAGLQLADVVASSTLQSLESSVASWDVRPAQALKKLFASEPGVVEGCTKVADYGFTLVPEAWRARLPAEQKQIFEHFGYVFK